MMITMITQTSAVAFRQNLGEMLNQVQYRRDSVVIQKDGKAVAVLVDPQLFERIRRMQSRFDALCARLERTSSPLQQADRSTPRSLRGASAARRPRLRGERRDLPRWRQLFSAASPFAFSNSAA